MVQLRPYCHALVSGHFQAKYSQDFSTKLRHYTVIHELLVAKLLVHVIAV